MKKPTVILINPANSDPPPNYFGPPYSLSLIGAVLLKNKKRVKAYDFDQKLIPIEKIICQDKPDYIGITIQSCTRGPVYELIKKIKKIDKTIKIILGGPFASQYYGLLLKNFPIDYVIIGDGEITLNELLDCLKNKKEPEKIKGIAFLKNKNVYFTGEREQIKDLDLLPYPSFHLFKDFDKKINCFKDQKINFILGKRCTSFKNALMLLSSRGCVYHCNFCPMSKVFKNKIRYHSPNYFVNMVNYFYKKHRIKNFIFGDNNFTLDKNRARKICDEIIRRKLKIKWSSMTRSDGVSYKLLKRMAKAGCFEIFYGVESGSLKIQKMTGKNLDLVLTKKAFEWTEKLGMRSNLMLMVGNLGETEKTIKETLAYIKDLNPSNIMVKVAKVYPGTTIHDLFENKGLLKDDYYLSSEFNPPAFTLEHPETELNEFENSIKTRESFIEISNIRDDKNLEEIKKELVLTSTRGECVMLGGGEPLLRKDFFEILNFAQKIPIHKVYLYSNGRLFFYRSLAQKIGKTKLQKIVIPLFGTEKFHDEITGVKNSFFQTVSGIKNLKKFAPNLKIRAEIFVSLSNYKFLPEFSQFLVYLGIDEFQFILLKDLYNLMEINPQNLPPINLLIPQFKKITKFLGKNGKNYCLVGFPLCFSKDLKNDLAEPHCPFDETINLKKRIINCRKERIKEKVKFDFCRKCQEDNLCEGLWKKYFKTYGAKELKPYRS
jgi:radical SAM superfamily enzyme YgiQ (UPF0313 family)/MoaA/NifB/PqqE/SkfB family radical SAM enzyme